MQIRGEAAGCDGLFSLRLHLLLRLSSSPGTEEGLKEGNVNLNSTPLSGCTSKKKADLGLILVWLRKGLKLVPVLPSLAAVSSVMDGEVSFCVTLTAASPFFLHSLL